MYLLNADSVFHANNMLISVDGLPGEKTGTVFLAPKFQGVSGVEMCVEAPLSFLKCSTATSIIRLNRLATQTKLSTSPSALTTGSAPEMTFF